MKDNLVDSVAEYYSGRLAEHGATAKGVDWNGEESQALRFEQLTRLFASRTGGVINPIIADLGCGYGALHDYMLSKHLSAFTYHGYDVSQGMCEAIRHRLASYDNVSVLHSDNITQTCDYGVASGIFSVRLEESDEHWLQHIFHVLQNMNEKCEQGFSFNCLTSYSDKDKMQDYLYYANPLEIFDYCKKNFSKNVALLHDYDLYEFTILVRK